jgi:branched-chain amino acid transport system permease protein
MMALGVILLASASAIAQALVDGLVMGLVFAFAAAGLALIWGVADIVNFAHGEFMMVGMYLGVLGSVQFGVDPLVMLPVTAVLLFLVGYVTYVSTISRVMDGPMLSQILTTFGILLVLRYTALVVFGPKTYLVDDYVFSGSTNIVGVTIVHEQFSTAVIGLVVLTGLAVLVKYTKTGRAIRAIRQDPETAEVIGVDIDRIRAITWGIGIAMAGISGLLIVTFFPLRPEFTPGIWTLIAFAVVALGGFSRVLAPIVGGIVVAEVQFLGGALLNPSLSQIYVFVVFILALIGRSYFSPNGDGI